MYIKDLLKDKDKYLNTEVTLNGWIRLHRKQKDFGFIDLSDGMSFKHIQVVYEKDLENYEEIEKLLVGSCISVKGKLIKSLGNEDVEISATSIEILGLCPEDYPIQAKRHTKEFLRENAYLRMRTNMFQAVFRIRQFGRYGNS
jgi:Aspartyl/asparaginyl-tRNA synthetases